VLKIDGKSKMNCRFCEEKTHSQSENKYFVECLAVRGRGALPLAQLKKWVVWVVTVSNF
jgi:hypothetical protein